MRLVYCERSNRRGLLLWNGGCVSFLCISEVNGVFFLEQSVFGTRMVQQVSTWLPSNILGDMRMGDIENPKEK